MSNYGGLKLSSLNGVKVYNVSGGRNIPQWLSEKKQRALRKDNDYLRRIELVQDMEFDTAATRVKATQDGEFLIVSGVYPPQVRVYELNQLCMKFQRNLDSEIVNFQILDNDYSKLAFLCTDRSVCVHAKFGHYYKTRIPRMGRDLLYDRASCDLLVAASSSEVYRLNLEQGRFLAGISTMSPAVNVLAQSPLLGLIACGGEDGALECFDLRQKGAVGRLDAVGPAGAGEQEVTAVRFDEGESMQLAVGTSGGQVLVYDLRSSQPLRVKDHMYECPIVDVKFHTVRSNASRYIVSSDTKICKIWDPSTGTNLTTVEPNEGSINDVCVVKDSGLIVMALDSPRMQSFFVPSLGPAPKWCSFLENLTEELEEEKQAAVYDDFKFVTREDLERLHLTNLIGTNLLRAYMHGFFVDHRLYHKAKAMADPFAYEAYRAQRVQEKLEAQRSARITIKRKLPKVNKELAARLMMAGDGLEDEEEEDAETPAAKKKSTAAGLLKDERFANIFTNPEFAVDHGSEEYRLLHPNAERGGKSKLLSEHFDLVDESDEDEDGGRSSAESEDASDSSLSSGENRKRSRGEREEKAAKQKGAGIGNRRVEDGKRKGNTPAGPRFYEAKDEVHAKAFRERKSLAGTREVPLEERLASERVAASGEPTSSGFELRQYEGGSKELSFVPKGTKHKRSDWAEDENGRERDDDRKRVRRGDPSSGDGADGRGVRFSAYSGARGRGGRGRGGGSFRGRSGPQRGGRGGGRGGGGGRGRGRGRGRRG